MIYMLHRILGRDQARLFARQVDSGAMSEAKAESILVDAVDTEDLCQRCEVDHGDQPILQGSGVIARLEARRSGPTIHRFFAQR